MVTQQIIQCHYFDPAGQVKETSQNALPETEKKVEEGVLNTAEKQKSMADDEIMKVDDNEIESDSELVEDISSIDINGQLNQNDQTNGYTMITNFDPDSDGFIFDLPLATKLHRNVNLLEFIRKRILSNKAKFFV